VIGADGIEGIVIDPVCSPSETETRHLPVRMRIPRSRIQTGFPGACHRHPLAEQKERKQRLRR